MTQEFIIDSEDIIVDFLRANLSDPRSRAEDTATKNVTATAGQTEITITSASGSVSAITSLTVEGVTKSKWQDYYWDYQNQKVTFFDALTEDDAVVINYKYGTSNWIYSDMPNERLSSTSFPRIQIFTVASPGNRLGQYNAPIESNYRFQIDIWSKDDYITTISDRKYSNEYLVRYIGNRITKALEDSELDLFPLLYNYIPLSGPRTAPYSERYQAYHSIVEVGFKGLRSGRLIIT